MNNNILLIEDSAAIQRALHKFFSDKAVSLFIAANGEEAWQQLGQHSIDLVLLDIILSDINGITLCQSLVTTTNLPVIMLTGTANTAVASLSAGASDYIRKPFDPEELYLRMNRLLTCVATEGAAATPQPVNPASSEVCQFAGWHYQPGNKELIHDKGQQVTLTAHEQLLLHFFIIHAGQILSREAIAAVLDNDNYKEATSRAVDTLVYRLKSKLKHKEGSPALIQSVRNRGYQWCVPVTTCKP